MSQGLIHFEVFARRTQTASMALELAIEDREAAMAFAAQLMDTGAAAVKVTKEVLDDQSGEYSSVVIFSKGLPEAKRGKLLFEEVGGPPCVTPNDLYTVHARQRIVRLLEGWLGRQKATPFELLHRPDLAERLEASGTDLQHAVQKIAIPEAHAKGVSVHEVIRTFNGLIERTIERLIKDGRGKTFANFTSEPFTVACVRLLDDHEGAYKLGGGVAAYIADAKTWRDKIDRLLDLADIAPADPRPRALAFEVLEQPLGEIIGSRAGMIELLGPGLDLGGSLVSMTRLACGPVVDAVAEVDPALKRALPPLEGSAKRLGRWMEGAYFHAVRTAIGNRIIADIKSSRRLRPSSTTEEIAVLRALAMALTAGQGKTLSGDDIREAFIDRSAMLIGGEFVNSVMGEADSAEAELRALIKVAENVTGPSNKAQAAQWLLSVVTALKFERELRSGCKEAPLSRLSVLADLQKGIARIELPESDKVLLTKRLGELGGLVEADAHVIQTVSRSSMAPIQQLHMLLKMAGGETAPTGPAAQRARAAALRLSQSPDVRADLTRSPELADLMRPLRAAG